MTATNSNNTPARRQRAAMVRHNGRVCAVGELSGAEIAEGMTGAQRAAMATALGIKAGATSRSASRATGQTRVQIVANAVATDSKCKGKAREALNMLADDDLADLSGGALVKMLGKGGNGQSAIDARNDVRAAIAESRGSQGSLPAPASRGHAAGWDQAIANLTGGHNAN